MFTLAPALTALAATLAVTTTPTPPAAQYPIGVTRCDVVEFTPALPPDGGGPSSTRSLEISFVNHAPVAAKDVRIVVSYAGQTQTIVDRGTYSPNITIDQTFDPRTTAFGSGAAQCSVSSVTFADGTTWQQG